MSLSDTYIDLITPLSSPNLFFRSISTPDPPPPRLVRRQKLPSTCQAHTNHLAGRASHNRSSLKRPPRMPRSPVLASKLPWRPTRSKRPKKRGTPRRTWMRRCESVMAAVHHDCHELRLHGRGFTNWDTRTRRTALLLEYWRVLDDLVGRIREPCLEA